jgi:DNA-binding response OmpR family regulator
MSKKILVIEDEDNVGKSIKTFLEQYDYRVSCLCDGISGLEPIREENPDLILTDLLLPRLHGFDICRQVKSDSQLRKTPVIVMTAVYKNAIHKLEAKRIGVEDFIEKPLNFSELLKKVERFLGPSTSPDEEITETITVPRDAAAAAAAPATAAPAVSAEKKNRIEDIIQDQFRDLQKDYASRLPQKILELEKIWESIQRGEDTTKQLAKFRKIVHSLSGSGATFGFKELTENARQLELLLDMIIAEGESTIEQRKNKIDVLLDSMRHHPLVATEMEIMRQIGF